MNSLRRGGMEAGEQMKAENEATLKGISAKYIAECVPQETADERAETTCRQYPTLALRVQGVGWGVGGGG